MANIGTKTRDIIEIEKMNEIIEDAKNANPYDKLKNDLEHAMWLEQCESNFPVLYLSSLYLYKYAKDKKLNKYIFATRDCCHWYKIFNKLYPKENASYFQCSRNMFNNATLEKNTHYIKYALDQVGGLKNINKTVFIDIHGTGRRMFDFFSANFSSVPNFFLLSASCKTYGGFPAITKEYLKQKKVLNLIFDARGGPIEMLNYDLVGTLQNYTNNGPIRDPLEYNLKYVEPYHRCIEYLLNKIQPLDEKVLDTPQIQNIKKKLDQVYSKIRVDRPIISKYIDHANKHGTENEKTKVSSQVQSSNTSIDQKNIMDSQENIFLTDLEKKIKFDKILPNDTAYGLIWEGMYNNEERCIIKMIKLTTGVHKESALFDTSDNVPYLHQKFKDKKAMNLDDFIYEVKQLQMVSNLKLSPTFFEYFISDKKYQIHYGFIVTKKLDCTLKDIFKKRGIDVREDKIIRTVINKMHYEDKISHGNMRPSNIGINLNANGRVKECLLLDCQKVKIKGDMNDKKFSELIKKDWDTYEKHKKNNRGIK